MLDALLDANLTPEERFELETYQSQINQLADQANGIVFTNEGKYHAAIVVSKILEKAKENVKIFSGNFNGDISNTRLYLKSLEAFLKPGGKNLDIIFEKQPNPDSKALELINNYKSSNRVSINVASEESLTNIKSSLKTTEGGENKMIHFMVGDTNMYRCETDTEKYKASGSFNDPSFSTVLLYLFEVLKKNATPYQFKA